MEKRPVTIQMFYPTGDTRGFRIAEVTNSIIEALLIPRKELETVLQTRSELESSGLYFLFAKDTNDSEKAIEVFFFRIYLSMLVAFCDKNSYFSQASIVGIKFLKGNRHVRHQPR